VAAVLALLSGPPPATGGDRASVPFAEPADPLFLALYPRMDRVSGLSPVAEPAVAAGRAAPRAPHGDRCQPGFCIAQPVTKDWTVGGTTYLLAAFLVTTDSPPGVNVPCYDPEPWACVLEKRGGDPVPIDCAPLKQEIVFADGPSIDTAPFRLNEDERAFGVRLRYTTAWRTRNETPEALVLFRFHERRLSQILAVQMALAEEEFGQGECSRELALSVEKVRTAGMFDWTTRTARKTGTLPCALESGTYHWDGSQYVRGGARRRREVP